MIRPRPKISIFVPIVCFVTTALWAGLFFMTLITEGSSPMMLLLFGGVAVMNLYESVKNLKRYQKEKNRPD